MLLFDTEALIGKYLYFYGTRNLNIRIMVHKEKKTSKSLGKQPVLLRDVLS